MSDRKKTVLAIDDDITILNIIRVILEDTYEVSLAKNTEIAETILNTKKIDQILLDINMPGESGIEFLEYISNDNFHYHIPVIVVSAQGTADIIIEIKKRGAVDFVVKPISPDILAEKIRQSLETARVKITRESLEQKLKTLVSSCVSNKNNLVEEILYSLEHVYFNRKTDAKIVEICKIARDKEYNLLESKVKLLISEMSKKTGKAEVCNA